MTPQQLGEALVTMVAKGRGIQLTDQQLAELTTELANALIELIDSHAKKKAAAVGDAAAAAITTEDQAEAAQRKS
jgi:hypothetical protein